MILLGSYWLYLVDSVLFLSWLIRPTAKKGHFKQTYKTLKSYISNRPLNSFAANWLLIKSFVNRLKSITPNGRVKEHGISLLLLLSCAKYLPDFLRWTLWTLTKDGCEEFRSINVETSGVLILVSSPNTGMNRERRESSRGECGLQLTKSLMQN